MTHGHQVVVGFVVIGIIVAGASFPFLCVDMVLRLLHFRLWLRYTDQTVDLVDQGYPPYRNNRIVVWRPASLRRRIATAWRMSRSGRP